MRTKAMKKLFSLAVISLLSLTLVYALSGCQSQPTTTENETQTNTGNTTNTTTNITEEEFVEEENANDNTTTNATQNDNTTQTTTTGEFDPSYIATINVEDYGPITVELYSDVAPETVQNFVNLAEEGFYNGLTFHRIIDGFMIQGGDPNGDGTGGSSENVVGEFSANGFENDLSHVRGTISMARSSDPDSGSSQFFIVQSDSTYLDGEYAGFGTVVDGMDVVDAISEDAEPVDSNGTILPEDQPVIESITIEPVN